MSNNQETIFYKMELKTSDCINYYCNQAGGGDYFKGVAHQRGYGLFGDIFRKISPFIFDAAKYVGKHLFSTGKKVVNDVASGRPFKESAKHHFSDVGRKLKDDVIHKLQSGSGIKRKRKQCSNHSNHKKARTIFKEKQTKDIFSK